MGKRLFWLMVIGELLSACGSSEVSPKLKEDYAREAVNLFAQSCVAYQGNMNQINAWLNQQKQVDKLGDDDIKKLPLGMIEPDVKEVWHIEREKVAYYLSLTSDSCSIKTEKADENIVRTQFMALAEKEVQGFHVRLRADNATQTPFPLRQLSYGWRKDEGNQEIILTANTSPSEQLPAQVVLYLTHQLYSVTPVVNP